MKEVTVKMDIMDTVKVLRAISTHKDLLIAVFLYVSQEVFLTAGEISLIKVSSTDLTNPVVGVRGRGT